MRRVILGVAVMVWLVPVANADNGVLEINQACAANTGCFNGDDPGWPVTIDGTAGRSYRLTSNLGIPNSSTNGILVAANDISIDLNGFVVGRAFCLSPGNCTAMKSPGSAITAQGPQSTLPRGLSVKNGTVMWMGSGIKGGYESEITNVRALWNGYVGISADMGSTVTNCTASGNLDQGIEVKAGSTVSASTAMENGIYGIRARAGSTIEGNAASLNRSGFAGSDGGVILRNSARENTLYGIAAGFGGSGYGGNVSSGNGDIPIMSGKSLGRNVCNGVVC